MTKYKIAIIPTLIILALLAGFYFRGNIVDIFDSVGIKLGESFKNFKKFDFESIVNEIKKEILLPPPLQVGGPANDAVLVKSKIITETNLQRQQNGLPALTENTQLNNAALAKANDMFKNQYFEHVSPTGIDPAKLVTNYEYKYIAVGENLILGNFASEKEMVESWMNSQGHRENILNNRYTEIGVSVVKGTYKGDTVWIAVQEFGLPLSTCSEPDAQLKKQIDTNKIVLEELSAQIDRKEDEIRNTNQKSNEYRILVESYNEMIANYNKLAEETKSMVARFNAQVSKYNQCVSGS